MIVLNDEYLEKQVEAEAERRGHNTNAKTLSQLVHERLMQIQLGEKSDAAPSVDDDHGRGN